MTENKTLDIVTIATVGIETIQTYCQKNVRIVIAI